ncbi:hypothetical protein F441_00866 [Phytophthora nicotianae CJ01A1]|uniref:Uncharacterized protein n=4 Tax=Phytophthora nicotianae TaxID=4792 RepID=W3A5F0_PHYNI|nr:hypothetical protein L915_00831 [Phytophthora nicotianae]ETO85401.1 hypothetical protein F444_00898 [Phytophthora nicotianae P1976]ETP26493.1 hypothetical protein F441_00866 [Phytophthora nicotianae CJ01A1]ETP54421.1 hypothetical protein F442_00844 [Phytophthora nicotianae P10297]ETL49843.1 hypothetical protein L916_00821 [Phytophthora nicotianae]
MPIFHCGVPNKQPVLSKMAARRSGPPPQAKSRSLSATREVTVDVRTEPVVDDLESKAESSTKTDSKQKKRSRSTSKSRNRSTSRTRQEQAVVAAAIDSEDDDSEAEEEIEEEGDIPAPKASVAELEVALKKYRRIRRVRRKVFEKIAEQFEQLDNEVYDLDAICEMLRKRRDNLLGRKDTSDDAAGASQEQPEHRSCLSKRARTSEANESKEDVIVFLGPVDPEVVASRVKHNRVVLTADSTPAEYWKRADASQTVVDHNRKA